jgi:hypothetical protein
VLQVGGDKEARAAALAQAAYQAVLAEYEQLATAITQPAKRAEMKHFTQPFLPKPAAVAASSSASTPTSSSNGNGSSSSSNGSAPAAAEKGFVARILEFFGVSS